MKLLFGLIMAAALLMGGYLLVSILRAPSGQGAPAAQAENNVTVADGKQIIELQAKGGYVPKVSAAKAGVPTVLRINTAGTFDCSSSIRIPSLGVSKTLPSTGVTDIALGSLPKGTLQGTCSMGMYPFQIEVTD